MLFYSLTCVGIEWRGTRGSVQELSYKAKIRRTKLNTWKKASTVCDSIKVPFISYNINPRVIIEMRFIFYLLVLRSYELYSVHLGSTQTPCRTTL